RLGHPLLGARGEGPHAFAFTRDAARVAPRPMARRKRAAAPERRFRVGRFLTTVAGPRAGARRGIARARRTLQGAPECSIAPSRFSPPSRSAWGWRARCLLRLRRTKPSRSLPLPR